MRPSNPSPRQRSILDVVRNAGRAEIAELAAYFGVSAQTVRRDVNTLCDQGALQRVHGGVQPPLAKLGYISRRILNLAAKEKIARACTKLVEPGQSLAVSIGTTPEIATAAIASEAGCTVLTNNLHLATLVCDRPGWTVLVPEGPVRAGDHDILGSGTDAFFDRYQVDLGIFGVGGVASDGTLLDFTEAEVASRDAILRNARMSVLLFDQSKLQQRAHVRGGHLRDVDYIITDAPLPEDLTREAEASGTKIIVAKGEPDV